MRSDIEQPEIVQHFPAIWEVKILSVSSSGIVTFKFLSAKDCKYIGYTHKISREYFEVLLLEYRDTKH